MRDSPWKVGYSPYNVKQQSVKASAELPMRTILGGKVAILGGSQELSVSPYQARRGETNLTSTSERGHYLKAKQPKH